MRLDKKGAKPSLSKLPGNGLVVVFLVSMAIGWSSLASLRLPLAIIFVALPLSFVISWIQHRVMAEIKSTGFSNTQAWLISTIFSLAGLGLGVLGWLYKASS